MRSARPSPLTSPALATLKPLLSVAPPPLITKPPEPAAMAVASMGAEAVEPKMT